MRVLIMISALLVIQLYHLVDGVRSAQQRSAPLNVVPKWFSFKNFQQAYNKSYGLMEGVTRQAIFVSKTWKIFVSKVKFRQGQQTYDVNVNEYSDLTEDEFREKMLSKYNPDIEEEHYRLDISRAKEIESINLQKPKVQILEDPASKVYKMLHEAKTLSERQAIRDEIYEHEIEEVQISQGFFDFLNMKKLHTQSCEVVHTVPDIDQIIPNPSHLTLHKIQSEATKEFPKDKPCIDWTKHRCFPEVANQVSNCHNCYAIVARTLAQFYKCNENDQEVFQKLSDDYIMKCSIRFSQKNKGCKYGSLRDTLKFVQSSGVYSDVKWKKYEWRTCQLRGPISSWGEFKLPFSPVETQPVDWVNVLAHGPVAVTLSMPLDNIDNYSGGVHPGTDCEKSGAWHSMILVGYGAEDGKLFWKFRNSWGDSWGDKGDLKLSVELSPRCINKSFFILRAFKELSPYSEDEKPI